MLRVIKRCCRERVFDTSFSEWSRQHSASIKCQISTCNWNQCWRINPLWLLTISAAINRIVITEVRLMSTGFICTGPIINYAYSTLITALKDQFYITRRRHCAINSRYSASGLAWMVTELIRIGCSGTSRSLAGTFSSLSRVSKPEMTLRTAWVVCTDQSGGGIQTYLPNMVYFLLRCAALA